MLHIPPTNCLLLTTKQEPYKKAYNLNKKYSRIFWGKKVRRMGQQAEKKDKTERARGSGRSTRKETAERNQMRALRFQTRGKTSDISSLPSGKSINKTTTAVC